MLSSMASKSFMPFSKKAKLFFHISCSATDTACFTGGKGGGQLVIENKVKQQINTVGQNILLLFFFFFFK